MKPNLAMAIASCWLFPASPAVAQHCPPIAESYLSQISVKSDWKGKAIDLRLEYAKSGGRPKEKYQAYLLAYLEKDEKRALSPRPADLINKEVVCVLDTQLIDRDKDGRYAFSLHLSMNELAKKILDFEHVAKKDLSGDGEVGSFKEPVRIAVFIPFLEDKTYSVLKGLPEDRHECNYQRARALLFQPLPYTFVIFYGYALGAGEVAKGDYGILINADGMKNEAALWMDQGSSSTDDAHKPGETDRPPFTFSRDTTYITKPLDKDGYPDYVAALNEWYGDGVTPENNAAVLTWRAEGPRGLRCARDHDAEYLKALGIASLPEKGDYLVTYGDFADRLLSEIEKTGKTPDESQKIEFYNKFLDEVDAAAERPWSREKFPRVADWLSANEKPASLLVEASKRPRRFDPLVSGAIDGAGYQGLSPFRYYYTGGIVSHECPRMLTVRAMLGLKEGRIDAAWNDLLAIHRLARQLAEGPSFPGYQSALGMDGWAFCADQAMLANTRLSAAQIAKMREDLDGLPPWPRVVEKIDVGNRYEYLNAVCWVTRGLSQHAPINSLVMQLDSIPFKPHYALDWDLVMLRGNYAIDRLVACLGKSTPTEREAFDLEIRRKSDKAEHEMDEELTEWLQEPPNLKRTPAEYAARKKKLMEQVADCLCGNILVKACEARNIEDRMRMQAELTNLAFALSAYRIDHGAYPAKLNELTPKYCATIPKDAFSDSELRYFVQDGGCVLYSIGPNRQDDGGLGVEDRTTPQSVGFVPWDDITIRLPAAKE